MERRETRALHGPNIWSRSPALEADFAGLPETIALPAQRRLEDWLARLSQDVAARSPAPGTGPALCPQDSGAAPSPGDCLALLARALQLGAGGACDLCRAVPTGTPGSFTIALGMEDEVLTLACLDAASTGLGCALAGAPFDLDAAVDALRALARRVRLGPSTAAIVRAARERDIPARRLDDGSLVLLGHGVNQRRILASETDRTGAVAQAIAQDKWTTRSLLDAIGVPVPAGRLAADAADAWKAAQEAGLPAVVKPRDGNQGRGVSTGLRTEAQVTAAFDAARAEGGGVLVERSIPGDDFRLLVVNGRVIAAARREPPRVVGDGRRSIAELVAEANRDPRRGEDHATALSPIRLDDPIALAVLAEQGFRPDSVPEAGLTVVLRRNANLSTGGTATDVTDEVHPDVRRDAVAAARVVGLDIAGVDLIAPRIDRPLEATGGAVIEVNAGPGLRMHLEPTRGHPRPVAEAIAAGLFPPGQTGRVPIAAVTGVNGKTTTTRLIAHLQARRGLVVGMTCTEGIFVGGRTIARGDCAGPASARAVLLNPEIEAAILETARGGLLQGGLGFDRCDVAVVTNIGEGDHLGQLGIETPQRLAEVKRVVVENVAPGGWAVLNAADPLVAAMADSCPGSILFFARDEAHPVIRRHRARSGRAAFVREGALMLADGDRAWPVVPLAEVPLTHGGKAGFQVENALAASAAGWCLGLDPPAIAAALASFPAGPGGSPGRFNVLVRDGITVIVDYGHNSSALAALISAIEAFPQASRTIVYSAVGDRRDADIVRQGELLGEAFDRVVLYEDTYTRGRPPGETLRLFRRGLARGPRVREVRDVRGGLNAAKVALELARPGDLVIIQPNDIDETLSHLGLAAPPEGPVSTVAGW